ncbi:MAG: PIN domain-containing protein, partial [Candidatus Acidiferrales bacterium]
SEFINRYARFEHELMRNADATIPKAFKAFRNAPAFARIAPSISVAAKKVVGHCQRVDSGFPELGVESLLDEYAGGGTDFNDQALASLCRLKGYKLVTDDSDFTFPDVTVITANVKLLRH